MFFFLSKLLPLFLYPLGLACLLLILALVFAFIRPAWTPYPVAIALVILLLASNSTISHTLVRSLEGQHIPENELPPADAIVVLGGAVRPPEDPRPMVEVTESGDRVLYAAHLYFEGKAPIIVVVGGRVGWRGEREPESEDMASLLELMGVPSEAIIQETESLNTYQNAVNVKPILQELGVQRSLLVTSAMHMPRSVKIFQRQNIAVIPAPTDFLYSDRDYSNSQITIQGFVLDLIPETYNLELTTQAIREYIGTFIYRLRGWL